MLTIISKFLPDIDGKLSAFQNTNIFLFQKSKLPFFYLQSYGVSLVFSETSIPLQGISHKGQVI